MEVLTNHCEWTILLNRTNDSVRRFWATHKYKKTSSECETTTHRILSFQQTLIIFAQCDTEDDGSDGFKAVDPFFPLGALTANVKHVYR